jgi:hypothetical protein
MRVRIHRAEGEPDEWTPGVLLEDDVEFREWLAGYGKGFDDPDVVAFWEKSLQDSAIVIELMTVGDFVIVAKGHQCESCGEPT